MKMMMKMMMNREKITNFKLEFKFKITVFFHYFLIYIGLYFFAVVKTEVILSDSTLVDVNEANEANLLFPLRIVKEPSSICVTEL